MIGTVSRHPVSCWIHSLTGARASLPVMNCSAIAGENESPEVLLLCTLLVFVHTHAQRGGQHSPFESFWTLHVSKHVILLSPLIHLTIFPPPVLRIFASGALYSSPPYYERAMVLTSTLNSNRMAARLVSMLSSQDSPAAHV